MATTQRANVINLSVVLGSAAPIILDPIKRAAESGALLVVSAGNEGANAPQLGALQAAQVANGSLIIAGSHDLDRSISSISNKAGPAAKYYLTALGDSVVTVGPDGSLLGASGTSYSAPIISGAAALLMSAFPNLKANQVVEILFRTADDAGAPGVDEVFGNGILNLSRAFQPVGTTTLAGSSTTLNMAYNGQLSAP